MLVRCLADSVCGVCFVFSFGSGDGLAGSCSFCSMKLSSGMSGCGGGVFGEEKVNTFSVSGSSFVSADGLFCVCVSSYSTDAMICSSASRISSEEAEIFGCSADEGIC